MLKAIHPSRSSMRSPGRTVPYRCSPCGGHPPHGGRLAAPTAGHWLDAVDLQGVSGGSLWVLGGVVAGYERMHCEDQPEGTPGEAQRDTRGNTCNAKPLIKKTFFIAAQFRRTSEPTFKEIRLFWVRHEPAQAIFCISDAKTTRGIFFLIFFRCNAKIKIAKKYYFFNPA